MSRSQSILAGVRRATGRVIDAWQQLEREQRLAALAALGLFVSMLLPWYSQTSTFGEHNSAKASQTSLSAFQAFSFVEAAVLLVSAGVLGLLFARGERRAFNLPGGDGTIIMIAGGWAAFLIFYRLLDKPGLQGNQRYISTVGVKWGIFIALLIALGLTYVGRLIRTSERSHPPMPRVRDRRREPRPGGPRPSLERPGGPREAIEATEVVEATPASEPGDPPQRSRPTSKRARFPPAPAEQMSFEDPPPEDE